MTETLHISPATGFIAEHAHYLDDAGFWEAHARRLGGPVIDVGAAAGRVTIALAALGLQVFATDTDPEMLAVLDARARAAGVDAHITTVQARLGIDPLPAPAALVIVPMNTLQVLVDPTHRRQAFADVASALMPAGEFIFDLSVPDLDDIAAQLGEVLPTGHSIDIDTQAVLTHTAMYDAIDADTRTLDFRVIIDRVFPDGSGAHDERPHHVHLFTPDEVRQLVHDAGLEVVSVHAGFHDEPFDPVDSERQVWRCRKPGAVA